MSERGKAIYHSLHSDIRMFFIYIFFSFFFPLLHFLQGHGRVLEVGQEYYKRVCAHKGMFLSFGP